jgi:TnpA family transposase
MTQAASSTGTPRGRGVVLPEDPSEEELARNWTLSEADRSQVVRCRGDDNRRRFAIQLCVLRQYGRFLEDYARVPVRILNHLNRQIHLPPALSLTGAERNATETEHHERIREYLGYQLFDAEARNLIEEHLRSRVAQGALASDLIESAEDALRFWKIILPPVSSLDRLVASIAATGRQQVFERIATRLADSTRNLLMLSWKSAKASASPA